MPLRAPALCLMVAWLGCGAASSEPPSDQGVDAGRHPTVWDDERYTRVAGREVDVLVVFGDDAFDGGSQLASAHVPDFAARLASMNVDVRVAMLSTDLGNAAEHDLGGLCPRTHGAAATLVDIPDVPSPYVSVEGDYVEAAHRLITQVTLGAEVEHAAGRCFVDSPLLATLVALSPREPPWPLPLEGGGTDRLQGFLRDDAMLFVLVVLGRDDCSHRTPELFDPDGRYASDPLGTRCVAHPEELLEVSALAEHFTRLRAPSTWMWAFVGAVPEDATDLPDDLLDRASMQVRLDEARQLPLPVCDGVECPWTVDEARMEAGSCRRSQPFAFEPPRRLVAFARALRDTGVQVAAIPGCTTERPQHALVPLAETVAGALP